MLKVNSLKKEVVSITLNRELKQWVRSIIYWTCVSKAKIELILHNLGK